MIDTITYFASAGVGLGIGFVAFGVIMLIAVAVIDWLKALPYRARRLDRDCKSFAPSGEARKNPPPARNA